MLVGECGSCGEENQNRRLYDCRQCGILICGMCRVLPAYICPECAWKFVEESLCAKIRCSLKLHLVEETQQVLDFVKEHFPIHTIYGKPYTDDYLIAKYIQRGKKRPPENVEAKIGKIVWVIR